MISSDSHDAPPPLLQTFKHSIRGFNTPVPYTDMNFFTD